MAEGRKQDPFRARALNRVGLVPTIPVTNHGQAVFTIIAEAAKERHNAFHEDLLHFNRVLFSHTIHSNQETDKIIKEQLEIIVGCSRATLDLLLAIGEAGEILELRQDSLKKLDEEAKINLKQVELWKKDRELELERIAARAKGRADVLNWLRAVGMLVLGSGVAWIFSQL